VPGAISRPLPPPLPLVPSPLLLQLPPQLPPPVGPPLLTAPASGTAAADPSVATAAAAGAASSFPADGVARRPLKRRITLGRHSLHTCEPAGRRRPAERMRSAPTAVHTHGAAGSNACCSSHGDDQVGNQASHAAAAPQTAPPRTFI
jgi:hypothetical protein